MPEVNGRLTCCVCGADLGDASDPYRDPDCMDCLQREYAQEAAEDEGFDSLASALMDAIRENVEGDYISVYGQERFANLLDRYIDRRIQAYLAKGAT